MKIPLRLLLAVTVLLALLAAACGGEEEPLAEEPAAEDGEVVEDDAAAGDLGLQQEGTIVVGSDIAFAPFEYVEDGENRGFDIDLMNEIASRLGLETEFVNTSFDTIFTQLAAGEFDAIISGITITEEREENIDFSRPYFLASQAITVPAGSEVAGVDDLQDLNIAVQSGTTGEAYAQENFADANTITAFPTSEAAFTALRADQVDAVFIDLPVAEEAAAEGDLEVAAAVDTDEQYGIGVQQGNEALLEAINEQLDAIIADGTYAEIYSEYFDTEVPEEFAPEA